LPIQLFAGNFVDIHAGVTDLQLSCKFLNFFSCSNATARTRTVLMMLSCRPLRRTCFHAIQIKELALTVGQCLVVMLYFG